MAVAYFCCGHVSRPLFVFCACDLHIYHPIQVTHAGKYTGYFQNGFKEGMGTFVYNKGHRCCDETFIILFLCVQEMRQQNRTNTMQFPVLNQFHVEHRYEGMWKQNRMHGRGVYLWKDGKKYDGEWMNGMRSGSGITIMPNGEKHDGNYKNNDYSGPGWWRFTSGKVCECTQM